LKDLRCETALLEIERVSRRGSFITLDAYRNNEEKDRMEAWNLTTKTVMHVDKWKEFFLMSAIKVIIIGAYHK